MTKHATMIALFLVSACGPAEVTLSRKTGDDAKAPNTGSVGDEDDGTSSGAKPRGGDGNQAPPAEPPTEPPTPPPLGPLACAPDAAFPAVLPVAEASGAAEVMVAGKPHLLVAADSNNKGAAILLPLPSGAAPIAIVLPLDPKASDDLEGLAPSGEAVYALTSAGAVMRFLPTAAGTGFTRDGAAYRIGAAPLSCANLTDKNCGKNWEGLCLRRKAPAAGECAGYAASKAEGALYCVTMTGTTLAIDAVAKPITLAVPATSLSDCSFGANALVVTTNDLNGSKSYVVDEKSGKLEALPVTGLTSNEAVLLGADGALYQFADTSSATSPASRFMCKGKGL